MDKDPSKYVMTYTQEAAIDRFLAATNEWHLMSTQITLDPIWNCIIRLMDNDGHIEFILVNKNGKMKNMDTGEAFN